MCVCVCAGTGGLRLLGGDALSGLLQLLSERDMPVDMLQLLVYMAEDGCRCVVTACTAQRRSVHQLVRTCTAATKVSNCARNILLVKLHTHTLTISGTPGTPC
jgi:hypothetical protein